MTGGYIDTNRSAFLLYNKLAEEQKAVLKERETLSDVQEQMRETDAQCIEVSNELQRIENKICKTSLERIEQDLLKCRGSLSVSKKALEGKSEVSRNLMMSLKANQAKIASLQQELQQVHDVITFFQVSRYLTACIFKSGLCFGFVVRRESGS